MLGLIQLGINSCVYSWRPEEYKHKELYTRIFKPLPPPRAWFYMFKRTRHKTCALEQFMLYVKLHILEFVNLYLV